MKRKPFIAANWKMNKLVEDSVEYGETLVEKLKDENVDLKKDVYKRQAIRTSIFPQGSWIRNSVLRWRKSWAAWPKKRRILRT